MPLDEREVVLSDEADRLEAELVELDEQIASLDPDNPAYDRIDGRGRSVDLYLDGLQWALDNWDADSVTIAGLTGGEFGKVEDELADAAAARQRRGGQPGARRVYLVAFGTVDAPYVGDEMSDDERVSAASGLPLAYQKWAEAQVNELSTVGGNGRGGWRQSATEKRQASADTNTSTTSAE